MQLSSLRTAIVLCAIFLFLYQGTGADADDYCGVPPEPGTWVRGCRLRYTMDGKQYTVPLQIYFPKGYSGPGKTRTLIGLHGYRFTMRDWERNSAIGEYADRYGFVIVCPDMGITLYESKYYPESTARWGAMPGGRFVSEILVPFVRANFGLARNRASTGIFGLSTGGRGAILLAAKHPSMFGAAAGLSGDYDPEGMVGDPLLTSIYGVYSSHRERWHNDDNVLALAGRLKNTRIYLGHGARDTLVPPSQTTALIRKLQGMKRGSGKFALVVERTISAKAGHDWRYWSSCVPSMMEFFNASLNR